MLCSWKCVLIQLLLIGFGIAYSIAQNASSVELDDNFLENEISMIATTGRENVRIASEQPEPESTTRKCAKLDLSAEQDELESKLLGLLNPTAEQAKLLKEALIESFDDVGKRLANQTVQSDAKICGDQKECVDLWMCKNSTKTLEGNYNLTFRSNHSHTACSYDQICCDILHKIEQRPSEVMPSRMEKCGNRKPNGVLLTIDGERHNEANYGEFPWMVALLEREPTPTADLHRYIGGGSILAPNVVLTAAHKVINTTADTLIARAGEWDRSASREFYSHQDVDVQQIIIHPTFQKTRNNIALLLLKGRGYSPSPHIAPICLPSANVNFENERCIVTGWGKRAFESRDYPNILKEIEVPIVPRDTCTNLFRRAVAPRFRLDPSSICAGGEKDVDSCQGDGGAPLVCAMKDQPNRYYQAGLVAWGFKCGMENVPASYTSVAHLVPWIIQELDKLQVDSTYYTV